MDNCSNTDLVRLVSGKRLGSAWTRLLINRANLHTDIENECLFGEWALFSLHQINRRYTRVCVWRPQLRSYCRSTEPCRHRKPPRNHKPWLIAMSALRPWMPTLMSSLECKLKSPISKVVPLSNMSTSRLRMLMTINRWCTWCHLRLSATVISCVPLLRSGLMDIYLPTRKYMGQAWYRGHPQTPSISPVQSITTVIPPLSPTLHLPRATAPQHGWIWALVSLQKATTISTATSSIAFACRTAPMCRKAWPLQSMRPTALQTVCFHTTATTVISGGIP